MAQFRMLSATVLALVIFVGGSTVQAQKSEPVEVKALVPPPPGSLGEQLARMQATPSSKKSKDTSTIESLEAELAVNQARKKELETLDRVLEGHDELASKRVAVRAERLRLAKEEIEILKKLEKKGDRFYREAREELQDEFNKNQRRDRARKDALKNAQLVGCEPDTVIIEPLNQYFDPFAIFANTVHFAIWNKGDTPIIIDVAFRNYGDIVTNLCSNGRVNITFKLKSLEEGQSIPIRARTRLADGRLAETTQYAYLQSNGQYQFVDNKLWTIDIR